MISIAEWYDCNKLINLNDLSGKKPELFIATTNRTGGKTTSFTRMLVNRWLKGIYRKVMFIYRYNYELENVSDTVLKDVNGMFFGNKNYMDKKKKNGVYREIYYDEKLFGYAVDLSHAEKYKKMSHLFSDVDAMFFDEFQAENNVYLKNEIELLISLHISVARGGGKAVRYVPVFMAGNTVSLYNPYYIKLGVYKRLKNDTKFLRGNGWVLNHEFIDSTSKAINESAFIRAFSDEKYVQYASQNVYLNDNMVFIEKPSTVGKYVCTIKSNGGCFGVTEHEKEGVVYVANTFDKTFPIKLASSAGDMDVNFVMVKRYAYIIDMLRYYFDHGCVRFYSPTQRDAYLNLIHY